MMPRSATRNRALLLTLVSVVAALGACTDSRESPAGRGTVRGINAVSDIGEVQFKIEGVTLETVGYQSATPFSEFDSLTYDFNFDYNSGLSGAIERIATTEIIVEPDTAYTVVVTGSLQAPRIAAVGLPEFAGGIGSDRVALWYANYSNSAGSVDIYIGPPGFDPAATPPAAAGLAQDAATPVAERDADEVQFVATPAGDPGTELIRSEPATLNGDDRVLVGLFDSAGDNSGQHAFVLYGEFGAVRLVDDDAPVRVQLVHAALTEGPIDVYEEPEGGALSVPLFAGVAFGDITGLAALPAADDNASIDITVTAAGNPGALLAEQAATFPDAGLPLQVVAGSLADENLAVATVPNSRRPFADGARVSLYNAIRNHALVDIYLLQPGETFDRGRSRPIANDAVLGQPINQFRAAPGTYSLYVVDEATEGILLGPREYELAAGDLLSLVLVDTVAPDVSDVIDVDLTLD